jgi:hypothetical protein
MSTYETYQKLVEHLLSLIEVAGRQVFYDAQMDALKAFNEKHSLTAI